MPTVNRASARKLAQELKARNALKESWRAIAESYPGRPDGSQIIKAGTLCRIANSDGAYLPDDREILKALGLIEQPKQKTAHEVRTRKHIESMARKTKRAVLRRK